MAGGIPPLNLSINNFNFVCALIERSNDTCGNGNGGNGNGNDNRNDNNTGNNGWYLKIFLWHPISYKCLIGDVSDVVFFLIISLLF